MNCPGGATFYGRYFACDGGHGLVDIINAISQSCDIFYYTLAERLGIEKIAKWAHALGLGRRQASICRTRCGRDAVGRVEDEELPREMVCGRNDLRRHRAGRGCGDAGQLARAIAGIASGGVFKRPHVVSRTSCRPIIARRCIDSFPGSAMRGADRSGELGDHHRWHGRGDRAAAVRRSARIWKASILPARPARAQVVNHSAGMQESRQRIGDAANAWFVGIAPRRNPDIVVVRSVGARRHGELARRAWRAQVIEAYVNKQRRLENNLQEAKAAGAGGGGRGVVRASRKAPVPALVSTAVAKMPAQPAMQAARHFWM